LATKPVPPRPAPRLYLATPIIDDPASLVAELPALLASADVAAVLVRLKETDPRSMISAVKVLAPAVQGAGAALLIDGHADLVARSGADGAHLNGIAALDEALPTLKPDRIAGVGGLPTRHDSMNAGERGADYVLFGEPDAHGSRPSTDAIAERLGWWAELFEPPCIGYATTHAEAAELRPLVRSEERLVDLAIDKDATVLVLGRRALEKREVVAQASTLHESGVRVRSTTDFYDEWLGKLYRQSASSVRFAKKAFRLAQSADFVDRLAAVERLYLEELMKSDDANEGLNAFVEKRKPVWQGR